MIQIKHNGEIIVDVNTMTTLDPNADIYVDLHVDLDVKLKAD